MYILYLNDKLYGRGHLEYINELITDYLITNKMYGNDEVSFQIVERENNKCHERLSI